jgi:hypothetical protein
MATRASIIEKPAWPRGARIELLGTFRSSRQHRRTRQPSDRHTTTSLDELALPTGWKLIRATLEK